MKPLDEDRIHHLLSDPPEVEAPADLADRIKQQIPEPLPTRPLLQPQPVEPRWSTWLVAASLIATLLTAGGALYWTRGTLSPVANSSMAQAESAAAARQEEEASPTAVPAAETHRAATAADKTAADGAAIDGAMAEPAHGGANDEVRPSTTEEREEKRAETIDEGSPVSDGLEPVAHQVVEDSAMVVEERSPEDLATSGSSAWRDETARFPAPQTSAPQASAAPSAAPQATTVQPRPAKPVPPPAAIAESSTVDGALESSSDQRIRTRSRAATPSPEEARSEMAMKQLEDAPSSPRADNPIDREAADEKDTLGTTDMKHSIFTVAPAAASSENTGVNGLSVFGLPVETAAFQRMTQQLDNGQWPEAKDVVLNDLIHTFDYGDPAPHESAFALGAEGAPNAAAPSKHWLRVHLRAADFEDPRQGVATAARVRVDFDPRYVRRYRLLGEDARGAARRPSKSRSKAGADIESGHSASVIYELKVAPSLDPEVVLGTVALSYTSPSDGRPMELSLVIRRRHLVNDVATAPASLRLSVLLATFADGLRRGPDDPAVDFDDLLRRAQGLSARFPDHRDLDRLVGWIATAVEVRNTTP